MNLRPGDQPRELVRLGEEDVKAKFEDGVLTLTFPKEEQKKLSQRRVIQIQD